MIEGDAPARCSAMTLYANALAMVLGGAALGAASGLAVLLARY